MSEASPSAQEIEAALDKLEAEGARSYDAPACDCVRALITRAEELGGTTGALILKRADSHVTSLRERFERDRKRVLCQVAVLEAELGEQVELRKAVERGEVVRAGRTARRLMLRPRSTFVRYERLGSGGPVAAEAATARANSAPGIKSARKRSLAYEDSVAEMVASLALARAVDVVPEDAGPYNALRIASDALDRMREISPFYLTVQLNRLEELATLLALPELPSKVEEKTLPPKRKLEAKAPPRKPSAQKAPAKKAEASAAPQKASEKPAPKKAASENGAAQPKRKRAPKA